MNTQAPPQNQQQQPPKPALIQRTQKETDLRRELNQVNEWLNQKAKVMININNDECKNIAKSMKQYADNLLKVINAS